MPTPLARHGQATTATVRALAEHLAAWPATGGFDWPGRNCCHFAAAWVWRLEGRDVLAGVSMPANASQARAALRALGATTLAQAITQCLGRQPMASALARLGDLVLLDVRMSNQSREDGLHQALGVCAGRTVVCMDEAGACVHQPLGAGVAAWRVERET